MWMSDVPARTSAPVVVWGRMRTWTGEKRGASRVGCGVGIGVVVVVEVVVLDVVVLDVVVLDVVELVVDVDDVVVDDDVVVEVLSVAFVGMVEFVVVVVVFD
jgi:hypothetical protein